MNNDDIKTDVAHRTRALHGNLVATRHEHAPCRHERAARWVPAPVTAPACSGSTERPKRNRRAGRCRTAPTSTHRLDRGSRDWSTPRILKQAVYGGYASRLKGRA
jgi:hypothetical protein